MGYKITRWPFTGRKNGLMMRMTNDPRDLINFLLYLRGERQLSEPILGSGNILFCFNIF